MMCIVHVVYPEHVVRARMQNMDYAHKKYYAYFVICIVPYELLISYEYAYGYGTHTSGTFFFVNDSVCPGPDSRPRSQDYTLEWELEYSNRRRDYSTQLN